MIEDEKILQQISSDLTPAGRGHTHFLQSVEGSDSVLLLLEADEEELSHLSLLDDGVGLGVVGTGAKLPELVQDAEIPVPYQYKIIENVSKKIV